MRSRGFRKLVLETELPSEAYWRIAPRLHRRWRHALPGYVDAPIDPFKLVSVDPERIVRFSAREYPIWATSWQSFGVVLDGDWDRRDRPPVSPDAEPDVSLYLADRFTETPLHEAMEVHFLDGVPWEETTFVQHVLERARDVNHDQLVWHECLTPAEVRERCRFLDRLYDDMARRGCLSARRLNAEDGRSNTFSRVMADEILADVSRDGELLFVAGRHRLSLAKILGLERVPIAIAARHTRWLAQRQRRLRRALDGGRDGRSEAIHPDLRHELGTESTGVSW